MARQELERQIGYELLNPESSGELVYRDGKEFVRILAKPEIKSGNSRLGWMSVRTFVDQNEYLLPNMYEYKVDEIWNKASLKNSELTNGVNIGISYAWQKGNGLYLGTRQVDYKSYLGTRNPDLMKRHGFGKLDAANPVGVCGALVTFDHKVLFTERGVKQENYQGDNHAVGGFVETNTDQRVSMVRGIISEMEEEIALNATHVLSCEALGLLYDEKSWHYELPYVVFTRETSGQIMEKEGDFTENNSVHWVNLNPSDLGTLLVDKERKWVPTGFANYLLLGRHIFRRGDGWYKDVLRQIG